MKATRDAIKDVLPIEGETNKDIIVLEKGSGYTKEPRVDIFYPHLIPTICEATVDIDDEGKITKINIKGNGTGYKNIPNIKVIENESV